MEYGSNKNILLNKEQDILLFNGYLRNLPKDIQNFIYQFYKWSEKLLFNKKSIFHSCNQLCWYDSFIKDFTPLLPYYERSRENNGYLSPGQFKTIPYYLSQHDVLKYKIRIKWKNRFNKMIKFGIRIRSKECKDAETISCAIEYYTSSDRPFQLRHYHPLWVVRFFHKKQAKTREIFNHHGFVQQCAEVFNPKSLNLPIPVQDIENYIEVLYDSMNKNLEIRMMDTKFESYIPINYRKAFPGEHVKIKLPFGSLINSNTVLPQVIQLVINGCYGNYNNNNNNMNDMQHGIYNTINELHVIQFKRGDNDSNIELM